jgi:hypothetical protein
MLTCPMCKKSVRLDSRECPTCRTDLSLLVEYVDHLEEGLSRAEALTRAGELGEAVWAYLSVLEVDPDNAEARRQVGQVAAAVRQFDRIAVGRRWLDKMRRRAHFRRWADSWGRDGQGNLWVVLAIGTLLMLAALAVGWALGARAALGPPPAGPPPAQADKAAP